MKTTKRDFVIYTAIVGNYDAIRQPEYVDESCDYILFSNSTSESQLGIWKVQNIPYTNNNPSKIARWVKTHPEILLSEYKASLWIDANIIISDEYVSHRICELYSLNTPIAGFKHAQRNCVYQEMFLLCNGFERESVIVKWGKKLRKEKYPQNNGLCETGILYRNHNLSIIKEFNQLWWECIEKYSQRDQFSFNYCLWKKHIDLTYFISSETTIYNYHHIKYIPFHSKQRQPLKIKNTEGWLRKYSQYTHKDKLIFKIYYWIYGTPTPIFWSYFLGLFFKAIYILKEKKRTAFK